MWNKTKWWRTVELARVLAALFASAAIAQNALNGWTATGQTDALQLVSAAPSKLFPNAFDFQVKNVSAKAITAMTLNIADKETPTADHFGDYRGDLMPGAVETFHASSKEFADSNHALEITAVLFADGTSGGQAHGIDFLEGMRLGEALEIERVRAILAEQPAGQEVDSARLTAFKNAVGRRPTSPNAAVVQLQSVRLAGASVALIRGANEGHGSMLDAFFVGVCTARDSAQRNLDELVALPAGVSPQAGGRSRSAGFSALQEKYKTLTAKQQPLLRSLR